MAKRVVLAYSGGLDTSVIVRWLTDKGYEVITYTADVGQGEELDEIPEKARLAGAVESVVEDVREEFARDFCLPTLRALALYEGKYPLTASLSRPLISRKLVHFAEKFGASCVAHGSTGKGNDQVRFELSVWALNPDLEVIAPVREWSFRSREEQIEYAKRHGIPVRITREKPYSIDRNLWGVSIECGPLEDPWSEPPEDAYQITSSPHEAPDGVGRIDMVENRLVGIKSREVYEAPGALILYEAYRELLSLVTDRFTYHYFLQHIPHEYAKLVYEGLWFTPLREALDAFNRELAHAVTGEVRLRLHKGSLCTVGRRSPLSLYSEDLATYTDRDSFDHRAGAQFTRIWGLPLKIYGRVRGGRSSS